MRAAQLALRLRFSVTESRIDGELESSLDDANVVLRLRRSGAITWISHWPKPGVGLLKEVIQPQVPLRLPCYDFTPVADYTVVKGFKLCLKVEPTPMV